MRFHELSAPELAESGEFWELYAESFPPAEREPRSAILRSLKAGVGVALLAIEGGHIAALATLHLLRDPAWTFLVYFAVAPAQHGRGIGRTLFEQAWSVGDERHRLSGRVPRGMVWEVEQPAAGRTAEEIAQRERRMAFFTRLGARMLVRDYVQPPLAPNLPALPMHLLAVGATSHVEVNDLVRAIRSEKYAAINGVSPDVIAALPAPSAPTDRKVF